MPTLLNHITSDYFRAANALSAKKERRRIVAYVESYDDVFFWRTILAQMETAERYFQVLLPFRSGGKRLERGKKAVLMSAFKDVVGPDMIACVDADYDYLKQSPDELSIAVCRNPYVFHTYAYAIENLQCWAPALHEVCVMATLVDDTEVFDFPDFLARYSRAVYPLFLWSILCSRSRQHGNLEIPSFLSTIDTGRLTFRSADEALHRVAHHADVRSRQLRAAAKPKTIEAYNALKKEVHALGLTADTTYLFIQGHFLFDHIVVPLLESIARHLTNLRRQEIAQQSKHERQRQNETACYDHSLQPVAVALRKHTLFLHSPYARQIIADLEKVYGKGR